MDDEVIDEQARSHFQAHLFHLGYQISQDTPIFEMLFEQYQSGELYAVVQTEFLPVFLWNTKAEALLGPYKVMVR
jgi:hypothetical protein